MTITLTSEEKNLLEIVSQAACELGVQAFVVGGFVRDKILNRSCKDIDVVSNEKGIELAQLVSEKLNDCTEVAIFKRFGTAMIKRGDIELEFVAARKESYRLDSRKPEVSAGSLEDDQLRRDFTINALAINLGEEVFGLIIDPFDGVLHIEQKKIVTPRDPDITFSDDPLRMMRAIRFACQLNFEIDERTFEAIKQNRERITIVSKERISIELQKIIDCEKPSIGFDLLFKSGLLELVFPELQNMYGVEEIDGKKHKDNFYHTLQVLDNLAQTSNNHWLRWSAILHDIGKPKSKRFTSEFGWTFHGHEAIGANMVPKIFRKMKLPLDHHMKYVQKMVRLHQRPISLTKENITDAALRRLIFDSGNDIEDLMLLCEADITSKNPDRVQRYLANYKMVRERLQLVEDGDKLRNWEPPIDGQEIMKVFNLKPSRTVGLVKNFIREAILDGEIPNTYDHAYELMIERGKELGLEPVN